MFGSLCMRELDRAYASRLVTSISSHCSKWPRGCHPLRPLGNSQMAEGLLRLILNRGCGKQQRGGPHALDAERMGRTLRNA
jgi:hypothetical protein